jgi:2-haloacid dehalogenase
VDSGESLSETVARLIAEHPEHSAPLAAWRDRWIETIGEEIPGTEELIDDLLAAGYRVVGLSNFSTETFPMCQAKFPVFEKFETIVLSGALGVTKPDPAIYHALCEQVGATPEQIVFTDDAQANVDGAQHVGMHAFFFVDSTQARNELRALGISV